MKQKKILHFSTHLFLNNMHYIIFWSCLLHPMKTKKFSETFTCILCLVLVHLYNFPLLHILYKKFLLKKIRN